VEETAGINKTYTSALPQDGLFPCRVVCPAGARIEKNASLKDFFSLEARSLYVSAKGAAEPGQILLSILDISSGRELLPPTDIKVFAFSGTDNFRHYFREAAGIRFTVENKSGSDATVDITIIGQRFFHGAERNEFAQEGEAAAENRERVKIEYDWVPKPYAFKFTAKLCKNIFRFAADDDPESGEQAAYQLTRFCRYRLTEISVHSSLPEELFAGAVHERMRFQLRTSRKHSFMSLPFGFSSHIARSEVDSYMQDAHSDEACTLIGNLYGSLTQTKEIIRLGSDKISVVVNCVICEGRPYAVAK
jgi:hypothetical protein